MIADAVEVGTSAEATQEQLFSSSFNMLRQAKNSFQILSVMIPKIHRNEEISAI